MSVVCWSVVPLNQLGLLPFRHRVELSCPSVPIVRCLDLDPLDLHDKA